MNTIHKDVTDLICEFRAELQRIIKNKFYGLYLYNSVAMGNFEPESSDIDFIVVLNDILVDEEIDDLSILHNKLIDKHVHGLKLDGMYLQQDMIGKMNNNIETYPYVKEGNLFKEGYFDINYITWWSLKEFEMAIDSPSIKDRLEEIEFKDIINTMRYNLNQYWLPKLEDKEIFKEDMWVEFGVLTLSRIIYTLKEGGIISKKEACEFILKDSAEWNDIVEEALAIRKLQPRSVISDISNRKYRAYEFIEAMISYGNKLLLEKYNK